MTNEVNPTNESIPEVTDREARMLLDTCFHYMDHKLRARLIAELPQAYNRYCGWQVVTVVHRDGRVA